MRSGRHAGFLGRTVIVAIAMVMVGSTAADASASSASSYSSRVAFVDLPLQLGDTGSDVSTLQGMLKNAGYNPGPIDGAYGRLTEQAVVALQTANGLEKNGRVSQVEWDLLLGGLLMSRGQRGDDVRNLQQRLADAGFNPGPFDGIFGGLTEQAISQFQSARSLSVTGTVDQATWTALTTDPGVAAVTYRRGDRGSGVRNLQLLLATAGYNPGPIDGIFGGLTESAVTSYQSANSLSTTGTVTQALIDTLSQTAVAPDVLLQAGARGAEVQAVQELVWLVGFNPGPFDGIFGSGTTRAVSRFQRVFGLPGDGTVNQQTLDKMNALKPEAEIAYNYGWTGSDGTEQWRSLVTTVFTEWGLHEEVCGTGANADKCIGSQIDNALTIMHCESRGQPNVVNYLSGTTGLFQHRPSFWDARTARVRDRFPDFDVNATPYNPEHNVVVAALLVWESRETLLGNASRSGPWDDGPQPWGHWDGSSRTCANPPLVVD
jgi:peptidoglycan hydrolase-like protein with peptidoglycan-binding domain